MGTFIVMRYLCVWSHSRPTAISVPTDTDEPVYEGKQTHCYQQEGDRLLVRASSGPHDRRDGTGWTARVARCGGAPRSSRLL
jgi:hypothetical protein